MVFQKLKKKKNIEQWIVSLKSDIENYSLEPNGKQDSAIER